MGADIILTGGTVFRGRAGGVAEAIGLAGGRAVATGRDAEIAALAGAAPRCAAPLGRMAVPACNEAHRQPLPFGLGVTMVNPRADELRTLEEPRRRLRAAVAPRAAWMFGCGCDRGALDIAVLSHDLTERPPEGCAEVPVHLAPCGGAPVFDRHGELA